MSLIRRIGYLIYEHFVCCTFSRLSLKKYKKKSRPSTFHVPTLLRFVYRSSLPLRHRRLLGSPSTRSSITLPPSSLSFYFLFGFSDLCLSSLCGSDIVHSLGPSRSIARRVVALPSSSFVLLGRRRSAGRGSSRCRAKSRRVQRGRKFSCNVAGPIQNRWIHDRSLIVWRSRSRSSSDLAWIPGESLASFVSFLTLRSVSSIPERRERRRENGDEFFFF